MNRNRNADDGFVKIPYVELSAEQKLEYDRVMRRGNKVLRTYHERVKAKIVGRYSRQIFRKELFAAIKTAGTGTVKVREVPVSKVDLALILKVRAIEWDVLCGVANYIDMHAKKWAARSHGTNLTFNDFYNEGVAAVMCAIYGFIKEGATFITFAHWAIHRRILNATNNAKPLSPWSQDGKKLYGQFTKFRNKVGMEVTFDEIIKLMKLDAKAASVLRAMLTVVVNNSQLTPQNGLVGSDEFDVLNICASTDNEEPSRRLDHDAIVAAAELSEWDRTVLEAFLNGGSGWMTKVAKENINPVTGEPYSRRAPRLALNRVLETIKGHYQGNVLADAA